MLKKQNKVVKDYRCFTYIFYYVLNRVRCKIIPVPFYFNEFLTLILEQKPFISFLF